MNHKKVNYCITNSSNNYSLHIPIGTDNYLSDKEAKFTLVMAVFILTLIIGIILWL